MYIYLVFLHWLAGVDVVDTNRFEVKYLSFVVDDANDGSGGTIMRIGIQ